MERYAIAVSGVHLDIAAESVLNVRLCYAWFLIVTVLRHIIKMSFHCNNMKITVIMVYIHYNKTAEKYYVS